MVNTTHDDYTLNAGSSFSANLANGDGDITVGPKPHTYWSNCCGASKKGKCHWTDIENMSYDGTCGRGYMVISIWSHNVWQPLPVILTFGDKNSPSFCRDTLFDWDALRFTQPRPGFSFRVLVLLSRSM